MGDVLKELEWVDKIAIEVATGKHFSRTPHETARAIVALFPAAPPSVQAMREALRYCVENLEGINAGTDIPSMVILVKARAALASAPVVEDIEELRSQLNDARQERDAYIRSYTEATADRDAAQNKIKELLTRKPPTPSHDGEIAEALRLARYAGDGVAELRNQLARRGLAIVPIPALGEKA